MTTIDISVTVITEMVKRTLSIIGKRSFGDNGQPLFEDITLSSAETDLISDYVYVAFQHVQGELAKFATITLVTEGMIVGGNSGQPLGNAQMSIDNDNSLTIDKAIRLYCVSYSLYSWFSFSLPRLADKYNKDCETLMAAIIRMVHEKKSPEASETDYVSGVSTSIS